MPPTAIIVEDDEGLRLIYQHVLTNMGFQVMEAADGEEAMALLAEITPDVLFLDVRLPFVSGLDILDYVRREDRFNRTHIAIASSGHHHHNRKVTGRMVEFILKPIRPAQIREIASRALG